MKIYHNPRCRKSRETLALIRESGEEPEIVLYLKTPPAKAELKELLGKLGMRAEDLVRRNEEVFMEKYKGREMSENEWLQALLDHPKLIERPIVVKGKRAVLGRPPENVRELL